MKPFAGLSAALLACALSLPGCVAAIPLAAGGAILQSQMKERKVENPADRAMTVEAALALPSLSPAESAGPADPLVGRFADHASSAAQTMGEGSTVQSALLEDPGSLRLQRRDCRGSLPAVLVDLDPATGAVPLDDGTGSPALVRSLADLRAQGIAVFWITSRGPAEAGNVRATLFRSGLDPQGSDGLVLMRYPGESKQERRQDLGDTICLLAIAGSERSDFDELYDYLRDDTAALQLEAMYGDGWFLIPPPVATPGATPDPVDQSKDTLNALDP